MQNATLRTATRRTKDTNIQHLHDETQALPLREHFKLHSSQIKQKAQHPCHPLHKLTKQKLHTKTYEANHYNNTNNTNNTPTYPNTVTMADISANKKTIHSAIITRHLTKGNNNKILQHFHPTSAALKRHSPGTRAVP